MEYAEKKDFVIILRNLVSPEICEFVSTQIRLMEKHIEYNNSDAGKDPVHPESLNLYSPFCTEVLSLHIQGKVEEALGRSLIPSYSYCRLYRSGGGLGQHLDRRSSEYTLSISLEDDGNIKWPLCVEKENHSVVTADLNVGDAVLYSGRDQMHWRIGKFEGSELIQAFIQYVDADGDSIDLALDGRPMLGMPFESSNPNLDHNLDRHEDEEKIFQSRKKIKDL